MTVHRIREELVRCLVLAYAREEGYHGLPLSAPDDDVQAAAFYPGRPEGRQDELEHQPRPEDEAVSENPARAFVRRVREEIAVAIAGGADENDCCIVMPLSYMSFVYCWPVIELDCRNVALATTAEALDLLVALRRESGWSPPPSGQHSGLWGFTQ